MDWFLSANRVLYFISSIAVSIFDVKKVARGPIQGVDTRNLFEISLATAQKNSIWASNLLQLHPHVAGPTLPAQSRCKRLIGSSFVHCGATPSKFRPVPLET